MSVVKTISIRELSRKTASVAAALQKGEIFELQHKRKTVGYLSRTCPTEPSKSAWDAHFEWLLNQKTLEGGFAEELEADRRHGWSQYNCKNSD